MKILNLNEGSFPIEMDLNLNSIDVPDVGTLKDTLDIKHLEVMVAEACEGLEGTNAQNIIDEANKNLYDGVTEEDARTSLVMTSRTLVEQEPNYTYVTARILLDNIRTEALTYLGMQKQATQKEMENLYPQALRNFLAKGVENEILNPELLEMDIEKLEAGKN